MYDRTTAHNSIKKNKTLASWGFLASLLSYLTGVYINGSISISAHSTTFFQMTYLSLAVVSLVGFVMILTACVKLTDIRYKIFFGALTAAALVFTGLLAFAGLTVGAFTNF